MRVLVVEDYHLLRESLASGLRQLGYAVDASGDGAEGLWYAENHPYDVIVLDLMLPKLGGIELLRKIREAGQTVPVLVLTARDSIEDRVAGLDRGADDYLVKPFAFDELAARLRALVRRRYERDVAVIRVADLEIDDRKLTTRLPSDGQPVELAVPIDKLNELLARLDASFTRERRFTGDVSHELRTPLAGLRTLLEVTAMSERSLAAYAAVIASALVVVQQLAILVENLISRARLEAGQLPLTIEPVELHALVDECWRPHA